MNRTRITISIERQTLEALDELVKNRVFANRSQAIQEAVQEKLSRMKHTRLAEECATLDPKMEQRMAEEGLTPTP